MFEQMAAFLGGLYVAEFNALTEQVVHLFPFETGTLARSEKEDRAIRFAAFFEPVCQSLFFVKQGVAVFAEFFDGVLGRFASNAIDPTIANVSQG